MNVAYVYNVAVKFVNVRRLFIRSLTLATFFVTSSFTCLSAFVRMRGMIHEKGVSWLFVNKLLICQFVRRLESMSMFLLNNIVKESLLKLDKWDYGFFDTIYV